MELIEQKIADCCLEWIEHGCDKLEIKDYFKSGQQIFKQRCPTCNSLFKVLIEGRLEMNQVDQTFSQNLVKATPIKVTV